MQYYIKDWCVGWWFWLVIFLVRHFHFETILQRITFRPSSVIISSMDHCQRIEYHAYKLNIRRSISSLRSYFEPRKVRRILLIHQLSANLLATILPLSDPHKQFQEQLRSLTECRKLRYQSHVATYLIYCLFNYFKVPIVLIGHNGRRRACLLSYIFYRLYLIDIQCV